MRNLLAAIFLLCAGSAQAAVIATAVESGGNVVISLSGSIDLTGWVKDFDRSYITGRISPYWGEALIGGSGPSDVYIWGNPLESGIPSSPSFGPGGLSYSDIDTGDVLLWGTFLGELWVSDGYQSGSQLSGSSTFLGQSLASVGISAGSYTWNLRNGDTITLNAVPIPASVWLFASGLGLLGWIKRRQTH